MLLVDVLPVCKPCPVASADVLTGRHSQLFLGGFVLCALLLPIVIEIVFPDERATSECSGNGVRVGARACRRAMLAIGNGGCRCAALGVRRKDYA